MIRARDVSYAWPGCTVTVPDWEVQPGERWAVHGPSGSGKSTLLRLLSGELVGAGELVVDGRALGTLSDAARRAFRLERVGFVFQDHPLVPHLRAWENVQLPLRLAGRANPDLARGLCSQLGVDPRARAGSLSQGERQRVAIARALVTRPALVLADEPTSGLDPDRTAAVLELLDEHVDATLVLVTHDPAVLARFDKRLAL